MGIAFMANRTRSVDASFTSLYADRSDADANSEQPLLGSAETSLETERNTDLTKQFGMGLEASTPTPLMRLRSNFRQWENILELMPYWRYPILSINIAASVMTVIFSAILVYTNFNNLPNQVSFIYSQLADKWLTEEKIILALFPIGLALIELIIMRLGREIFNFDRRLSIIMAGVQLFANVILIIGLFQILSLKLL